MPKKYILDKVFDVAGSYRAESDKAYIIRKAGSTSTSKAQIKPAGGGLAEILDKCAPMFPINTNLLAPLDLGDLFLVVPPDKVLEFSGSGGSEFRLIGEILELAPGEVLPGYALARYAEQAKRYLSYQQGTYDRGDNVSWPADLEMAALTFTCPAGERWLFDGLYMAQARKDTTVEPAGDWASRLYVDDVPFDIIEAQVGAATYKMGKKGIEHKATPYPPAETVNFQAFSLAALPITLNPGRTLKVTGINVSGADKAAGGAGVHYYFDVLMVGKKELLS